MRKEDAVSDKINRKVYHLPFVQEENSWKIKFHDCFFNKLLRLSLLLKTVGSYFFFVFPLYSIVLCLWIKRHTSESYLLRPCLSVRLPFDHSCSKCFNKMPPQPPNVECWNCSITAFGTYCSAQQPLVGHLFHFLDLKNEKDDVKKGQLWITFEGIFSELFRVSGCRSHN